MPTSGMERKFKGESPTWLIQNFEQGANLLVIDCRPFGEYAKAHIEGAINISVSGLMVRRLKKGNIPLKNFINSDVAKIKFENREKVERVVLYDEKSEADQQENPLLSILLSRLGEDNIISYLSGGFRHFEECYPHLCQCGDGESDQNISTATLGLSNLKLFSNEVADTTKSLSIDINNNKNSSLYNNSTNNFLSIATQTQMCNSKDLMFRPDSGPVEIIPKLYLGNQKDSSDLICLQQLNITHILNVTHNIPNLFENMDKFRYLTLPVEDNSDGNMMDLFPKAFDFIDAALSGTGSVLVHCVGGISRSSTIIIAYLMFKQNYTLNDAYDFVKVKKPNVAPNFNFMGQLLDLETSRTSLQINPPQTSPSIEYTDTATRMLLVANSNNQAKMIVIDQCSSPGSSSSSGSEMTSTSSLSSSAASSLSFNLPNDFKSFQSDL